MTKAKKIAKTLAKEFQRLADEGQWARDGKKVAAAMNRLREERRLTWEELHRASTI